MNHLIIHSESSMGWGGQEIRIMQELIGMQSLGYATALLAPEKSTIFRRAQKNNISAYPVNLSSKLNPIAWIRVYLLLKKLKPKVVNTHSSEDSWIVGAVARFLGKSLVIRTRHVSTPIGSLFSYRHFPHLIMTTSQSITNEFIKHGLNANTVATMPTGINTDHFGFSPENRKAVRTQLGVDDHQILVGNICVLRSWKGLYFFVETAALLPEPFRFILVGDGPQKQLLQDKARSLGLTNKIIFAGHQEHVSHYFSAIDILFYTSYASEGVPQSLLQGVSSGLPVIAVRLPPIEETLKEISKVLWVEYGGQEQAADALQQARTFLETPRTPPPATWCEKHSLAGMLNKIDSLYQEKI